MPSSVPVLVACMVCGALLSRAAATALGQQQIVVLPHEDRCRAFNASTLRYATETLISNHTQLAAYLAESNMTLVVRNATDVCSTGGLLPLIEAMEDPRVVGVVGGLDEEVCAAGELLAQVHRKPLVVWNCHGYAAGALPADKASSVYFGRVSSNVALAAFAVASCLNDLRVKYAVLVVCEEQPWLALANELEAKLRPSGLVVRRVIALSPNAKLEEVDAALRVIKAPVKAVLLSMDPWGVLLSRALKALHAQAGVGRGAGSPLALFLVSAPRVLHPRALLSPALLALDAAAPELLRALFVVTFVSTDTSYAKLWKDRRTQQLYRQLAARTSASEVYAAFRYFNAVSLLITALWRSSKSKPSNGAAALPTESFFINGTYPSLPTSPSRADARGQVQSKAVLLDYSPGARGFVSVRETEFRDAAQPLRSGAYQVSDRGSSRSWIGRVDWPGGRRLEPDPECVLKEVNCGGAWASFPLTSGETVGVTASLIVCLSAALGVAALVRRKLAVKQMRRRILLSQQDISLSPPVKKAFDGYYFERPDILRGSHDSLRQVHTNSSVQSLHASLDDRPNCARLKAKGDTVYLKYLIVHSPFEIKTKAMKQLQTMYEIRHENVNPFLGCLADPSQPALVWEMCTRGSLTDVLASEDIRLDWTFRLSLLNDLVKGMRYLHNSPIRQHGHLTSRNCVIDSRWVLKVTDYGMPSFQDLQAIATLVRSAKDLLWTAPELLRGDCSLLRRGTQVGDVYSFAIVMQEVLLRGDPYCMLPLTAEEIIEKLKHPPPLIRPSVSKQTAPPEALHIMRQCWAESPDMRPDFDVIADRFKSLYHGRKANIVETMFQMLEKYSNNLEDLIRERTVQLDEEKKKTEQLLNRMLPSSVAETLKAGLPVVPEKFEEVTVYFSDIVGFTTISAYSEPMEIVDFLNDLYTAFDSTINHYNVYKVETIGDAYMVVGGLPERTRDHAEQVATMALDLLHHCGRFRIRHMPNVPLMLRIGLHTGAVVAGVVGLTMPRYCLFGDTVNTASRMESTGRAYRIHISKTTERKLRQAGGYSVRYRGEIVLKGRGRQPTYWLIGKQGFNKALPEPPQDDDWNNHGFKDEEIFKALGRKKADDILDAPPSPMSPCGHNTVDGNGGNGSGVPGVSAPSADSDDAARTGRPSLASAQDFGLPDSLSPCLSPVSPSLSWQAAPDSWNCKTRKPASDSSGAAATLAAAAGSVGAGLKKSHKVAAMEPEPAVQPSWPENDVAAIDDPGGGVCGGVGGKDSSDERSSWPATRNSSPSQSSWLRHSCSSLRQLSSPSDTEHV
ncbi:retinal guanylyl cyclase 1-like isoform X1 [Dermacentor albipictus]|uniref:retinal guanylyl cyclase 1-like isoform X1 n=1 Tax=Dermacentor albipictus TaxID=60249 RepID=UPI0038FCA330